jgi:Na+-translocating ferredoxin:NAD+ oxidoreductase subunit E
VRAVRENPLLVLVLGLCPALAVTTRLIDALWISLGVAIVLVGSSAGVSLVGRAVSPRGRRAASLLVVASLVSLYDLGMRLLAPEPRAALGVYLPVIAVNCLVLGRSELAGSEASLPAAVGRATESALSFSLVAIVLAALRETLGSGTLTLFPFGHFSGTVELPFLRSAPALVAVSAAGGLILLGFAAGGLQWISDRRAPAGQARQASAPRVQGRGEGAI